MNWEEFRQYILTHLWKQGDGYLLDNLPTVVKTAEAELNVTFKVEARNQVADAQAISRAVQMPHDFKSMVSLSNPLRGGMTYVSQRDYATRLAEHGRGQPNQYYTYSGQRLYLTGEPTPTQPFDLVMVYYRKVPSFVDEDASWLVDDFFNVYLYCVLKHTAPFLREDERIAVWNALYTEAFNAAMEENAHDVKFAGTPMKMRMQGVK